MVGWHPVTATRLGEALAETEKRGCILNPPLSVAAGSLGSDFFFCIAGATLAYGSLTPA